jgi:hypothetical protein
MAWRREALQAIRFPHRRVHGWEITAPIQALRGRNPKRLPTLLIRAAVLPPIARDAPGMAWLQAASRSCSR